MLALQSPWSSIRPVGTVRQRNKRSAGAKGGLASQMLTFVRPLVVLHISVMQTSSSGGSMAQVRVIRGDYQTPRCLLHTFQSVAQTKGACQRHRATLQ